MRTILSALMSTAFALFLLAGAVLAQDQGNDTGEGPRLSELLSTGVTFDETFSTAANARAELVEKMAAFFRAKAATEDMSEASARADATAVARENGFWSEEGRAEAYKAAFESRRDAAAAEEAFTKARVVFKEAELEFEAAFNEHQKIHQVAILRVEKMETESARVKTFCNNNPTVSLCSTRD
jgi:hypothetical protein